MLFRCLIAAGILLAAFAPLSGDATFKSKPAKDALAKFEEAKAALDKKHAEELANPKIVSERLGHSSIQITLNTYSHVLPTMQGKATSALNDIRGGRKASIS